MGELKDNEKAYDEEIAPALLALGKRCEELGMPFLAVAEWAPGQIGRTEASPPETGLAFRIIQYAARATPNFDSLAINLIRYCRTNNIDTSASMFLSRFSKD